MLIVTYSYKTCCKCSNNVEEVVLYEFNSSSYKITSQLLLVPHLHDGKLDPMQNCLNAILFPSIALQ